MAKWTTEELAQHKANFFAGLEEEKPKAKRKTKRSYTPTQEEKRIYKSLCDKAGINSIKKIGGYDTKPNTKKAPSTQAQFFRRVLEAYGNAYDNCIVVKIDVNGVPLQERVKAKVKVGIKWIEQTVTLLKGFRPTTATSGVSDVQIWYDGGRVMHVEIKGKGDTEKKKQQELREKAQAMGHAWIVFKDIRQIYDIHRIING